MAVTGNQSPWLCLNPLFVSTPAFSSYLLPCPVEKEWESGCVGTWPRSAHHTREEQAMITNRQLWKEHLNPGWNEELFVCVREPAQPPYKHNSTRDLLNFVLPFFSRQQSCSRSEKRPRQETQWFLNKGRVDLQQRIIFTEIVIDYI